MRKVPRPLAIVVTVSCTQTNTVPEIRSADGGSPLPEAEACEPGWHRLPASPLSPRQNASAFWTDSEVLIVGGRRPFPCFEECAFEPPPLRDGAA